MSEPNLYAAPVATLEEMPPEDMEIRMKLTWRVILISVLWLIVAGVMAWAVGREMLEHGLAGNHEWMTVASVLFILALHFAAGLIRRWSHAGYTGLLLSWAGIVFDILYLLGIMAQNAAGREVDLFQFSLALMLLFFFFFSSKEARRLPPRIRKAKATRAPTTSGA